MQRGCDEGVDSQQPLPRFKAPALVGRMRRYCGIGATAASCELGSFEGRVARCHERRECLTGLTSTMAMSVSMTVAMLVTAHGFVGS
jgi:hypothetical protein